MSKANDQYAVTDAAPVDDLLAFNPDKPVTLPGSKCAYCGRALESYGNTTNGVVKRYDTALPEDEDRLFALPDDFDARSYAQPHWR